MQTTPTIDIVTLKNAIAFGSMIHYDWGNGRDTFCMMSALVPGAQSYSDCAMAGWPVWLTVASVSLYDLQPKGSANFALEVAENLVNVKDYDRLEEVFISNLLDLVLSVATGEPEESYLIPAITHFKNKDSFNLEEVITAYSRVALCGPSFKAYSLNLIMEALEIKLESPSSISLWSRCKYYITQSDTERGAERIRSCLVNSIKEVSQ